MGLHWPLSAGAFCSVSLSCCHVFSEFQFLSRTSLAVLMPLGGVFLSTDIQTSRHKDRRKGSLDVRSTTSRGSDGMLNQQVFFLISLYIQIFI